MRRRGRGAWLLAAYAAANMVLFVVWQRQQNQNGQVRQAVIRQVGTHSPWEPGTTLCVTGLASKFEDIDMALPLWVANAPHLLPAANCTGDTGRELRATFRGGHLVFDKTAK